MQIVSILISFFLLSGYTLLIWLIQTKWESTPEYRLYKRSEVTGLTISVIVVARNEENTIENCLQSIARNHLSPSKYEILLIDDHSTDSTVEVVRQLAFADLRILHLKDYQHLNKGHSFKKQAVQFGVNEAKGDIIVITDADCTVTPKWLSIIEDYFNRHQPDIVAGPVLIEGRTRNAVEVFQTLDMMGTIAFTQAGISLGMYHLANGANLSFKKRFFQELNAYENNLQYASGDDVFLIQKAAQQRNCRIRFIKSKDCIVKTEAMSSIIALLNQRLRWARKSFAYKEYNLLLILGLIFLFHVSILANLLLAVIHGAFIYFLLFAFQVLIKFFMDLWLLKKVISFFDYPLTGRGVTGSFVIQWIYILVVGLGSFFIRRSVWKGRKVEC